MLESPPLPQTKRRFDKDKYLNLYPGVKKSAVKKTYRYDELTGKVYRNRGGRTGWQQCKRHALGHSDRYITSYKNTVMSVPDVAWLLCKGDWPKEPLKALDGNLTNTLISNLIEESATLTSYGNYLVRPNGKFGEWEAKVWHHPYFYKGSTFKNPAAAENWAKTQLATYNEYAFFTEAGALTTSDEKETPIKGVYDHPGRNLYQVKVILNGEFKHHSYEKNIEDAIEAQAAGQAEIEEIWKSIPNE